MHLQEHTPCQNKVRRIFNIISVHNLKGSLMKNSETSAQYTKRMFSIFSYTSHKINRYLSSNNSQAGRITCECINGLDPDLNSLYDVLWGLYVRIYPQ
jgi:hypothetical protein